MRVNDYLDRIFVVDIICFGTVSPQIWNDYILSKSKESSSISQLSFKDKRKGWLNPTAVVKIDGKEKKINDYKMYPVKWTVK
ncbi:MAG: Coenzyme F420 hydrogenase/dehydrogenase, beta subunit C-terminal domain [Erysipelotrichaceae bacterium]|nr:Coenzyme F420 hydrogenase/dehydrogenase, beta subunit C-terminal domain [Erysipelotrichaceae bacterium]